MLMTMAREEKKAYRESLEIPQRDSGEPGWVRKRREEAFRRFGGKEFPTRREEDWRTMDLGMVLDHAFRPAGEPVDEASLQGLIHPLAMDPGEARLVFVDGYFSRKLSRAKPLAEGVILKNLSTALREDHGMIEPYFRFSDGDAGIFWDINEFSFNDGAFLYVPPRVSIDLPIDFIFMASGQGLEPFVFYPRSLVVLGKGAKVRLVTHGIGTARTPYFMNAVLSIFAGEGSRISWIDLQAGSGQTRQFLHVDISLERGSSLEAVLLHGGGGLTRTDLRVDLNGEESSVLLKGLGLLKQDHELYQHITVNHNAPFTTSRQHFRNILVEKARSEYDSLVQVRTGAIKADSNQLNKNLVLSPDARAYTRPRLRIDADDVKCTHGTTVGQLEEGEKFYLKTRGLDERTAGVVLTHAFAAEILEGLPPGKMRLGAESEVRHRLEGMIGAAS